MLEHDETDNTATDDASTPDTSGFEQVPDPSALPAVSAVGVGELDPAVYRFNWGAFLMFGLWGLIYGVWPLIGLWATSLAVQAGLAILLADGAGHLSFSALLTVSVVSEVTVGVFRLWAGLNANRLLWAKEQVRLSVIDGSRPKYEVGTFLRRQRLWAVWGTILLMLAFATAAPQQYKDAAEYGLGIVWLVEPLVWLLVEVGLGVWLAHRMRVDGPDTPEPLGSRV